MDEVIFSEKEIREEVCYCSLLAIIKYFQYNEIWFKRSLNWFIKNYKKMVMAIIIPGLDSELTEE